MADFKKQGGSLSGREERYDGFEGEPRAVGSALGGSTGTGLTGSSSTGTGLTGSSSTGTGLTGGRHHNQTTAGPHSSNMENKLDPRVDSDMDGSRGLGRDHTSGAGYNNSSDNYGSTGSSATHKKPGLLDRLNPMKDTDGDGKKGFMD